MQIVLAAKQLAAQDKKSTGLKWPLTGGVPGQLSFEKLHALQIYMAGFQDGSVRLWDATYPALSLVYNVKPEVSILYNIVTGDFVQMLSIEKALLRLQC